MPLMNNYEIVCVLNLIINVQNAAILNNKTVHLRIFEDDFKLTLVPALLRLS